MSECMVCIKREPLAYVCCRGRRRLDEKRDDNQEEEGKRIEETEKE